MLEEVKKALRVTNSIFDSEIQGVMEACKKDLQIAGVKNISEGDVLITRAIILYAKANFGFNEDSEKYQQSYDYLKTSLCLAGDYI